MGRADECHEELRSVRVRSRVGHRQNTRALMLVLEVLVWELVSVDRLTACAISASEVTTLGHEPWDNSMESAPFEVKRLSTASNTVLASAEGSEVL